jgi:hypothetical protein
MQVKDRGKGQATTACLVTFRKTIDSEIPLDSTEKLRHFNQSSLRIGKAQHSKYIFFMNLLKRSG